MRLIKYFLIIVLALGLSAKAPAALAKMADEASIMLLKKDLREGKVLIGKTRLKHFKTLYGKPSSIKETAGKLIYNYGDLKVEFNKNRYFRDWEYDYSYPTAYSDDIDSLRFDLEDQQIAGDYFSFETLRKDYGEPSVAFEAYEDGQLSRYHYGELKLIFENFYVVRSWSGKELSSADESGVLGSKMDLTADKGVLQTE